MKRAGGTVDRAVQMKGGLCKTLTFESMGLTHSAQRCAILFSSYPRPPVRRCVAFGRLAVQKHLKETQLDIMVICMGFNVWDTDVDKVRLCP